MLFRSLPVADVRPTSLYPYFSMLPVWNLQVQNSLLDDYNVIALFNWEDEAKTISFSTEEIGVRSDINYILYEFWEQKGCGTVTDSFSMKVPGHSVRLLAMHPLKDIPQWISSDRHITQNALELKEYKWIKESQVIEGKIGLISPFPLTMRLHVPKGFYLSVEIGRASCRERV